MSFDGRWTTSFGPMTLRQDGARVTGTYGRDGTENTIEGEVAGDSFTFRYEEANEHGDGLVQAQAPQQFRRRVSGGGKRAHAALAGMARLRRPVGHLAWAPAARAGGRPGLGHERTRRRASPGGRSRRERASAVPGGGADAQGRRPSGDRRFRLHAGWRVGRGWAIGPRHRRPARDAEAGAHVAGRARGALAALARRQRVRLRPHAARAVRAAAARAGPPPLLS